MVSGVYVHIIYIYVICTYTVTSLLTDRRLRSWLSGAVLTVWARIHETSSC